MSFFHIEYSYIGFIKHGKLLVLSLQLNESLCSLSFPRPELGALGGACTLCRWARLHRTTRRRVRLTSIIPANTGG
jgi:hypothetical protein